VIVTYKTIKDVEFPIYKLESSNWYTQDGIVYLDGLVLDDTNQPGRTLGIRRMQTPFHELVELRKACTDVTGVVKQSNASYIDTLGKTFIYQKTKFFQLKYYKIKEVQRKDTFSLLWVKGINSPYIIPRPPPSNTTWVGILHLKGLPWLLYDYSKEKLKNTRRMV
jgi:hypothetical protein